MPWPSSSWPGNGPVSDPGGEPGADPGGESEAAGPYAIAWIRPSSVVSLGRDAVRDDDVHARSHVPSGRRSMRVMPPVYCADAGTAGPSTANGGYSNPYVLTSTSALPAVMIEFSVAAGPSISCPAGPAEAGSSVVAKAGIRQTSEPSERRRTMRSGRSASSVIATSSSPGPK